MKSIKFNMCARRFWGAIVTACFLLMLHVPCVYCQEYPALQQYISLINLIANGEQYHNQQVVIRGFVKLDFEDTKIVLNEDYSSCCTQLNTVRMLLDTNTMTPWEFLQHHLHYCTVYGKYIHEGGCSSGIIDVQDIMCESQIVFGENGDPICFKGICFITRFSLYGLSWLP